MPVVELAGVTKAYENKVAVNNLSLSIDAGQMFGLLGPNGSGKTSSIRMIMGITIPDSGSISLFGKPFDRKSLERWLQSQSRYQAQEAEKLATRPWSELSWPDRLRRTRVLGPIAVAVHCLFVKGLIFDGTAGFLYTAQRVAADVILSMHLLRRDLQRLAK